MEIPCANGKTKASIWCNHRSWFDEISTNWCSLLWRYSGMGRYYDVIQSKTSPFSVHRFIWLNYTFLGQLSQPISLLFSYLNSVLHNLVIELCHEKKKSRAPEKNNLNFFLYGSFWFFQWCTFSHLFLLRVHYFMAH